MHINNEYINTHIKGFANMHSYRTLNANDRLTIGNLEVKMSERDI